MVFTDELTRKGTKFTITRRANGTFAKGKWSKKRKRKKKEPFIPLRTKISDTNEI